MDELFDKIFFINLDGRKDRLNEILLEFEKMGIKNFERYSAVKPSLDFLRENQNLFNNLTSWKRIELSYITACTGCKLSHYNIIKIAKERGYKRILILEDDVLFTQSKEETIRILKDVLNSNFNFVYLGGNNLDKTLIPTEYKNLFGVKNMLTAHAYIVNSNIYDYVLENMLKDGSELDCFYISGVQKLGKCYTIKPCLAVQRESFSDILQRNVNYSSVIN